MKRLSSTSEFSLLDAFLLSSIVSCPQSGGSGYGYGSGYGNNCDGSTQTVTKTETMTDTMTVTMTDVSTLVFAFARCPTRPDASFP